MVFFPTEETVQALIDHLLYPLLPFKTSVHESPSLSKQESVAKQMHAVVLLYNYYHRKQFPGLEFLCFEDFCKVAVNSRPSLLAHMKFMQRCTNQSGELDTQLSITEEMVVSACNICKELDALDASGDASSIESWPVSKVAVFLVDSMKDNCLLQFSSKTQGFWSPIEKDLDSPHCNIMKGDSQMKDANRKRTATHASRNELSEGEAVLQQLAFTAVKEETGIDETDLTILESHIAYSLSKKKSISQFYLMQCTKAVDGFHEEVLQVPIKDAIGRLRSPLVSKRFGTYEVTAAVEYFHLLPYADIISDWFSRESSGISSQHLPEAPENPVENCSRKVDKPHNEAGGESGDPFFWTRQNTEAQDDETCRSKSGTLSKKENDNIPLGAVCSPQVMTDDSSFSHSGQPWQDAVNNVQNTNPDAYVERKNKSLTHKDPKALENGVKEQAKIDSAKKSCHAEKMGVMHQIKNDNFVLRGDVPLVSPPNNCQNLDKLEVVLASKGNDLLKSALRALQIKRDELCHQHRQLEDEIALCEKNIEAVISGGEDNITLKIESIINACNAACSKGGARSQTGECLLQPYKRRRLSDAILILRNPCQKLDDICIVNNWILPRYSVHPSDGGFLANVTVKGLDFEFSGGGNLQSNSAEARESAASQMLRKLRSMSKQLQ